MTWPTWRDVVVGPAVAPLLAVMLWGVGVPPPAPAQESTTEGSGSVTESVRDLGFQGSASVQLILVPLVAKGRSGYVHDLEQGDFRLLVDGRPVEIELFERGAHAPLSLVVMQDLSGSMAHLGKLDASRLALEFFLERARPFDEFALASFAGGRTSVEVPYTSDVAVLRESMAVWEGYGTTALYDAIAHLPDLTTSHQLVKRAALLITDGVDNASEIDPNEAQRIVEEAELPVYVLGLAGYAQRLDDETFRYADLLRLLAEGTGGRYYSLSNLDEVGRTAALIFNELRQQYVLGFSALGSGDDRYHPIRVEVGRRRTTVEHRRGYTGGLPASLSND